MILTNFPSNSFGQTEEAFLTTVPTFMSTSVSKGKIKRIMKTCWRNLVIPLFFLVLAGCSLSADENGFWVFSESFDFNEGQFDWEVDFTDYPAGTEDSTFYELTYAYTKVPANLGVGYSMMLSGNNHSDDLFMFMKKKITGLTPNTTYAIVYDVELASNAKAGEFGVGGAPGESVYLKGGASGVEPVKIVEDNCFKLNVDKGNQSAYGDTSVVLGDISVPSSADGYTLISRNNAATDDIPLTVPSNSLGEIWLFIGTDSGFEGTTTVYYTKVNVVFSASN